MVQTHQPNQHPEVSESHATKRLRLGPALPGAARKMTNGVAALGMQRVLGRRMTSRPRKRVGIRKLQIMLGTRMTLGAMKKVGRVQRASDALRPPTDGPKAVRGTDEQRLRSGVLG